MFKYYFLIFLFSFFLSYVFTMVVKKIAIKFGWFVYPGTRRVHTTPIPLLGGISIFLSIGFTVAISLIIFFLFEKYLTNFPVSSESVKTTLFNLTFIITGGLIILIVGLLDDLKKISFEFKFIMELIVVLTVVISGTRLDIIKPSFLSYLITIIWILGITNSFNLLDNMDGITAGLSSISGLLFFILSITQGQFLTAMLILVFVGACLGFLKFNFSPASIFMGDCGSLFIGYFLGTLAVTSSYYNPNCKTFFPIFAPLLVLSIPLLDTSLVTLTRIKNKKPIYIGDANHITHRLNRLGLSHRQVAIFIYLVSFSIGIGSLFLLYLNFFYASLVLLQSLIILAGVLLLIIIAGKNNNTKIESSK